MPEHRARLPAQEAMSHCGGMPRSAALRPSAPRSAPLCSTMQPRAPGVAVRAYTRAHALRHTQPHTYTCSRLFWRRLMCSRDPGTIESDAFSNCSTALLSASCKPDRRRESNDGNRRRTVPCQTGSGDQPCSSVEQRGTRWRLVNVVHRKGPSVACCILHNCSAWQVPAAEAEQWPGDAERRVLCAGIRARALESFYARMTIESVV